MKTYRLITLVAAVLITVFVARFLSDGKIGVPPDGADVVAAHWRWVSLRLGERLTSLP